jgi:alpha-N-acetylglucosaminidase
LNFFNVGMKSAFEAPPDISGTSVWELTSYSPVEAIKAWTKLLEATSTDPTLLQSSSFHYDFVDIGRQVLVNLFTPLFEDLVNSWNSSTSETASIKNIGGEMLQLLADLDDILATDENFLVARWISAAKSWTNGTDEDSLFLEYDARNQITLWVSCVLTNTET